MPPTLYSFLSRQPSIDTLPAELLTEIFLISCAYEYELEIGEAILPFQHTLSNVSRRWRAAASQCPTLWSHVTIDFSNTNLDRNTRKGTRMTSERALDSVSFYQRIVRHALANTGNALLDIVMFVSGRDTPQLVLEGVVEILRDLVAQCERWRSFTGSVKEIPVDVFAPLHHHLPRLQRVAIDYSLVNDNPAPNFQGISHIFADAPRLVDAHCRSDSFDRIFFEMPWEQLHRASLRPSSHQQLVHYLQSISHSLDLRQLVLSGCESLMASLPLEQQTVLPYVEELTLFSLDVVPYLRLPSLVNLSLQPDCGYSINHYMDAVISFLTRSKCELRALEMDSYESSFNIHLLFPYLGRLQVLHLYVEPWLSVNLPALQECVSSLELEALRELEISFGTLPVSRNADLESPEDVAGAVLGMVWEAICARKESASKLQRVGVEVSFAGQRRGLWKKVLLTCDRAVLEGLRGCSFEIEVLFRYYYEGTKLSQYDLLKEAVVNDVV